MKLNRSEAIIANAAALAETLKRVAFDVIQDSP